MNPIQELREYIEQGHDTSPDYPSYSVEVVLTFKTTFNIPAASDKDAEDIAMDMVLDREYELDDLELTRCDIEDVYV